MTTDAPIFDFRGMASANDNNHSYAGGYDASLAIPGGGSDLPGTTFSWNNGSGRLSDGGTDVPASDFLPGLWGSGGALGAGRPGAGPTLSELGINIPSLSSQALSNLGITPPLSSGQYGLGSPGNTGGQGLANTGLPGHAQTDDPTDDAMRFCQTGVGTGLQLAGVMLKDDLLSGPVGSALATVVCTTAQDVAAGLAAEIYKPDALLSG
jgi:hypothetical protein